jgi:hypothetical protein
MNIDKQIYIIYDSNTLELWNDVHKKLSWFSPCPPVSSTNKTVSKTSEKKLKYRVNHDSERSCIFVRVSILPLCWNYSCCFYYHLIFTLLYLFILYLQAVLAIYSKGSQWLHCHLGTDCPFGAPEYSRYSVGNLMLDLSFLCSVCRQRYSIIQPTTSPRKLEVYLFVK